MESPLYKTFPLVCNNYKWRRNYKMKQNLQWRSGVTNHYLNHKKDKEQMRWR